MIFLGNPASVHLETWRDLYARRDLAVDTLFTIHAGDGPFPLRRRVAFGGKLLSYLLLGLRLRAVAGRAPMHAHGASGYGLAALVSGRPYVVTIYGSELLAKRGRIYGAMVRQVLRRARFITVTSRAVEQRVRAVEPTLGRKVLCFHTGIDPARLDAVATVRDARRPTEPVRVMCIRNAAPQYRTREILTALKTVVDQVPPFTVTVPLGNGDPAYFARLREEFTDPWIIYIDAMLPRDAYLALIHDADLCINFPLSDQTSATLIEAVYFDRAILTVYLDAYADLFAHSAEYDGWRIVRSEEELVRAFVAAVQSLSAGRGTPISEPRGADLVAAHYGPEAAALHLGPILEWIR